MKRSAIFRLALLCTALVAFHRANTWPTRYRFQSSLAYSQEVAKQKALARWYGKWHEQARILASTGVVGECAAAFWRQGNRWAIGVALGKRSESEADSLAMKYCLQHCPPGAQPKIERAWRGD
jgi:hypothetical protein